MHHCRHPHKSSAGMNINPAMCSAKAVYCMIFSIKGKKRSRNLNRNHATFTQDYYTYQYVCIARSVMLDKVREVLERFTMSKQNYKFYCRDAINFPCSEHYVPARTKAIKSPIRLG